jgi:capsular exopolysaccharide synthesis family protein
MSRIYEATQRASHSPAATEHHDAASAPPDVVGSFPREQSPLDGFPSLPAALPQPPRAQPAVPTGPAARTAVLDRRPRLEKDEKLVSLDNWTPSFAEYRRLVATLIQAQPEGRALTIMVTSAMPGEGKTLTAANVALTFAHSYERRVLLVDADMRRPYLHQLFGTPNNTGGLGACLKAGRLLPNAAMTLEPGLTLLTAGQPEADPVSYLSSSHLQEFVRDVAGRFDCVVFDTPPAVLLPDAELLASVVETTLLVVQSGRTPYRKVERAIEAIGRDRIAGVVLNQVSKDSVSPEDYADAQHYGAYTGKNRA